VLPIKHLVVVLQQGGQCGSSISSRKGRRPHLTFTNMYCAAHMLQVMGLLQGKVQGDTCL
jgi:hypothetical protein